MQADSATSISGLFKNLFASSAQARNNAQRDFVTSDAPFRPAVPGNGWTLHTDKTAWHAMHDAIKGAQKVVNVEFYGITDMGNGGILTNALEDAARRGVEVNVLADWASTLTIPPTSFLRFRRRIKAAGGNVIVTFTIPKLRESVKPEALQNITHRKVVTVDGNRSFTGGMNLFWQTDKFRDLMLEVNGAAGARLALDQLHRLKRSTGQVSDLHRSAVTDGLLAAEAVQDSNPDLQVVTNAPDIDQHEISDRYLQMIRTAQDRLWITSPVYTDRLLVDEIAAAARRGVDVRLVGPGPAQFGIKPLKWINRANAQVLLEAGARFFETPELLHMKVIVADQDTIVSSFNISGRSREMDHEVGIHATDQVLVGEVARLLESDMARSLELQPEAIENVGLKVGQFLVNRMGLSY